MNLVIGVDNRRLIIKRKGSRRINPFVLSIGRRKNWVEFGLAINKWNLRNTAEEYFKRVNHFLFTDHKIINGTKRYYLFLFKDCFILQFSHEVRN